MKKYIDGEKLKHRMNGAAVFRMTVFAIMGGEYEKIIF